MSDTPRTDKCEKGHSFAGDAYNAVLTLARQLERELSAARAELSTWKEQARTEATHSSLQFDQINALKAELEACRADAERYRWLRSQHEGRTEFGELDADGFPLPSEPIALAFTVFYPQEESLEPVKCDPGSLDAAIDAAREG